MNVEKIHVLLLSANYPDDFHLWAPWNKRANLAISKVQGVKTEVVAPRPFSLPLKFFPYSEMSKIPLVESAEEGTVYHPRFLYPLPKKFFYNFTGNFYKHSISKYVLQNFEKPNLIHSHHIYPDGYGIIPVCKKWCIPLVVDIHGDTLFTDLLNNKTFKRKVMETLNFSSKINCISENIYSLTKKIGIDEEKLEYVPLGVDINKFKPRNKDKIRCEFGMQKQRIILFVGQLNEKKGVKYLLHAVSHIASGSPLKDIRVVIIGEGAERKNLLKLSQKLGIENSVTFKGILTGKNLLKWYSLADLFVLPSSSEGRPTVINEAMASECAIVATNVSGIPEQVKDEYNGFLVEPKNSDMLAEKISYLLKNEDKILIMQKNSRKRIIEKGWTWDGYTKKVMKIYKEVIG